MVARVDVAIGHLFAPTYRDFARKTRRRARDYLYYSGRGERTYPWGRYRRGLGLFVVATVTTVPLLAQSARRLPPQARPRLVVPSRRLLDDARGLRLGDGARADQARAARPGGWRQ